MTAPSIDFASSDHYAVLGVSKAADEAELSRAYKALARKHHPDKNANKEQAEVAFKRIAEAYSVLRDSEKRREYDRTGGVRSYVSYEEASKMWRSYGGEDEADGLGEFDTRRKAVGLVVVLVTLATAPRLVQQLLPGLIVGLLGMVLFTVMRRENSSKWAWVALLLLMATYAAPAAQQLKANGLGRLGVKGSGGKGRGAVEAKASVSFVPHSGEEVLIDGHFVRPADPQNRQSGKTAVTDGWQQRLLSDMTDAIKKGEEQVVMVFSRQGCPWCDRMLPVLQRAIQRRSGLDVEEPVEADLQAAFLFPGVQSRAAVGMGAVPTRSGGLLFAPLRIFVFDAGEFPYFVQSFNVQAFPTTIAWGSPGVPPLSAQGYLDDANFADLLKTVAVAKPEEVEPTSGKKKKSLFR